MRFNDWYFDEFKNHYFDDNDDYDEKSYSSSKKHCPKPEPKPCCYCPKPEPKPEPKPCCCCHKPEPKPPTPKPPKSHTPLVAQLTNPDRQDLGNNTPFLFTGFDGVSITNPAAPIYYASGSITINRTGRFIITYNTVVRFDDALPTDRVRLQLNKNGTLVTGSDTIVRDEITGISPTVHTVTRTTLVNVQAGDIIQFFCRRNLDSPSDFFRLTTLVIEEV